MHSPQFPSSTEINDKSLSISTDNYHETLKLIFLGRKYMASYSVDKDKHSAVWRAQNELPA